MRSFLALLVVLSACASNQQEEPFSDGAELSRLAVPRGSVWRYWDRGGDLGTGWRGTFDDASWSTGAGPLGYGESYLSTTVAYGSSSSSKHVTTYFRRTFTVADPALVTALAGELMYDDGAVVYLNGTEIARASMPTGTVTAATLASGHEASNAYRAFDWTAHKDRLVAGTNVIAVEVHQAERSSSDLVFDLALSLEEDAAPTTLVAEIPRRSRWSFWDDGGDLGNGWRLSASAPGWSTGSGVLGYGESYIATPVGYGGDAANKHITTYFTRALLVDDPTAVTGMVAEVMWDDGFALYLNGTPVAARNLPTTITAATLASGHEAGNAYERIDLAQHLGRLRPGENVIAVEVHQADRTSSDLVFDLGLQLLGDEAPPPSGGAGIARGSEWRYWDGAQAPGSSWMWDDFDDASWKTGAAPLGFGESYLATTTASGTMTTYVRRWFDVEDPSVESTILGELMFDDGAVVYLNGHEIARASMPTGYVRHDTPALGHEAGNRYEPFDWSAANALLVPGPNLIAVEVHQQSVSSSDLVFDLALAVDTPPVCGIPACGPAVAPPAEVSLAALSVGPGAVWVGGKGTIGRKLGEGDWCWCERAADEGILASWAAADDDVWFVGTGGLVLHHDGAAFTRVDVGTTEDLRDVWGSGPDDVWVIGASGVVRHFDGATWSDRSLAADVSLRAVWGAATGEVWIGGTRPLVFPDDPERNGSTALVHRWDAAGSSWKLDLEVPREAGAAGIRDLHGSSAGDVWAIGSDHPRGAACSISAAWRYDGTTWARVETAGLEECRGFSDVEVGAPGAEDGVWIGGDDDGGDPGTLRYTGGVWTVDASPAAHDLDRIDHHGERMFATGGSFNSPGFRHKIVRWVAGAWTVDW